MCFAIDLLETFSNAKIALNFFFYFFGTKVGSSGYLI